MRINALPMITLALLILAGTLADAQSDFGACPSSVGQSYEFTENFCGSVTDGQACIGNGQVSATPVSGARIKFELPGDLANLSDIGRFQTRTMTADARNWTTVVARLETTTEDGAPATIDLLAVGDVVMWQAGESASVNGGPSESREATVFAETGARTRRDANSDSEVVWQLRDRSNVDAIGRSADGQWIRILLPSPNGGAGWVFSRLIEVDGGAELLPVHTNETPFVSANAGAGSVPAYRMESLPASENCPEAPDSGLLLQSSLDRRAVLEMNGVKLTFAGTVFLTAQVGGEMGVYNLEGVASLIVNGVSSDVPTDHASVFPMDNSLQPAAEPGQPGPFDAVFASRVQYLPFQLLTREIAASPEPSAAPPTNLVGQCPSLVQETYNKTSMYCDELNRNQLCLGNVGAGMIDVVPHLEGANLVFALPGDITNIHNVERVSLNVGDDAGRTWSTLLARVDADTGGGSATMIIFGDVDLENNSDAMRLMAANQLTDGGGLILGVPAQVQLSGSVSVQAQPRVDSDAVALIDGDSEVMALVTSVDGQWVQLMTQDGIKGWVVAWSLSVEGGVEGLPVADNLSDDAGETTGSDSSAEMEAAGSERLLAFDFVSLDGFPSCDIVPPSGMLIQSPSEGSIEIAVNGASLAVNGTVFLTASQDTLTVYGLERATELVVDDLSSSIFAGEQAAVPMVMGRVAEASLVTVKQYSAQDSARLIALPTNLLPRSIGIPMPSQDDPSRVDTPTVGQDRTGEEAPMAPEAGTAAEAGAPAEQCVISAGAFARNIRQGPGTDYEIVDVLRVGGAMIGQTQKRGTFGLYWYHTDRGWIRFDAGEMTDACERLPLHVAFVAPSDDRPPPPLHNEILGDVCAAGGAKLGATISRSGSRYHEFAGLWTGQAGASVAFQAQSPYFHESFVNVITFVNADGSHWLGSTTNNDYTINFAETRSFRVRVSGLLGDYVTLQVSCL